MVTKDDVYKMSKIAKISVTEAELLEFTKSINDVLRFVDTKNELDLIGNEFCSLHDTENVFREDEEINSLTQDEALQNTVCRNKSFFSVKSYITGG